MKLGTHPMTPAVGASGFIESWERRHQRRDMIEQTTMRCGRMIEQLLTDHGYIAKFYAVLNASQVTVETDDLRRGEHVRVQFPHPGKRLPGEMTAERYAPIELFGGPGDGEHFDRPINDDGVFAYVIEQPVNFSRRIEPVTLAPAPVLYRRAGYDFESNRFIYTMTGR